MKERIQNLLAEIGFNGLEASVYVALLHEPAATGYRVSQMVGKPVANTYKALDALKVKGAVVVDQTSGTRTYAALSIHEYLDGMRRNLDSKQELIERELKEMVATPMHGGIFELTSVEQVYERARNLIREAQNILLIDAFPHPLEKIRVDLNAAIKRGVKVFVKAYTPTKLAGADLLAPEKDAEHLKAWNGDWLNVFVDCGEYLQSFLKKDNAGVHEAIWSRNPYLGFLAYSGFVFELFMTKVEIMIHAGSDIKGITQELRRLSKRYMEETCVFQVIPENWKGRWLKERLKELEAKKDEKSRESGAEKKSAT
jgi:HTH-type transcriptional regulator, sugar sensing transcriptional regulator